jgi:hypothetical protein
MTKHTILFLAANSSGADRLTLDREARSIQVELERSGLRDRFEFVTRWAAEPLDLLRELRKLRPTVVHFSGHCQQATAVQRSAGGSSRDTSGLNHPADEPQHDLYFQSADGGEHLVSAAAIKETFGAAGSSVRLVVLNACYSTQHAEALLVNVDCVVGMVGAIRNDAGRHFAVGFYGGLGEGESFADAYMQGRAAMSLEGLRDDELPQLKVREGVDAKRLVLATVTHLSTPTQVGTSDTLHLMGQPKLSAGTMALIQRKADVSRLAGSDCDPAAVRGGALRRGRGLWIGVAIVLCGAAAAAWGTSTERRLNPPSVLSTASPAQVLPQLRAGISVELAWSKARASVELPQPRVGASTERAQSRAGDSVESEQSRTRPLAEPSHTPPLLPRDCQRADAASPMCSYRGTLRRMNSTPMSNIKIELVGTDCITITNDLGVFDFKACDPNQTRRLENPGIFLHLSDHHTCKEVPLQRPPRVTKVNIDLETCGDEQEVVHSAAAAILREPGIDSLLPQLLDDVASGEFRSSGSRRLSSPMPALFEPLAESPRRSIGLVASSSVKKIQGSISAVKVTVGKDGFAEVMIEVCIDEYGHVSSVKILKAMPEIIKQIQRDLTEWRYEPYIDSDGRRLAVCFPVWFSVLTKSVN